MKGADGDGGLFGLLLSVVYHGTATDRAASRSLARKIGMQLFLDFINCLRTTQHISLS